MRTTARCTGRARGGMVLIMVLIGLALVMVMAVAWLKTIATEQRQAHGAQQALQAEYLARSAVNRAAAQLARNAAYQGETWRLAADELDGHNAAQVSIRVEATGDDARGRRLLATADFPSEGPHRARRSKQIEIQLPASGVMP